MATNIKIYDSYEVNGKTYKGSFPVYVSDAICEIDPTKQFESDLEKQLKEISED